MDFEDVLLVILLLIMVISISVLAVDLYHQITKQPESLQYCLEHGYDNGNYNSQLKAHNCIDYYFISGEEDD